MFVYGYKKYYNSRIPTSITLRPFFFANPYARYKLIIFKRQVQNISNDESSHKDINSNKCHGQTMNSRLTARASENPYALIAYTSGKGSNEHAHPHSFVTRAFAASSEKVEWMKAKAKL